MTCWWSLYRSWYFTLSTLGTAAPWDPPKGHAHRIYASDDFEFHESEIEGHFDEIEEQLWAYRNGLSNIVFTITVRPKRPRRV